MGWADLFLSGWASQTGLTNDPMVPATAGGISDSLMRPWSFCAYRDRRRKGRLAWWETQSGKWNVTREKKDVLDDRRGLVEGIQAEK